MELWGQKPILNSRVNLRQKNEGMRCRSFFEKLGSEEGEGVRWSYKRGEESRIQI